METGDAVNTVATIGVLSLVLTKLVDTARNMFDGGDTAPKWTWNLLGLGLGTAAAFIWELDILALVKNTEVQKYAAYALTGLSLGAAASGWHEVLDSISSGAKAKRGGNLAIGQVQELTVERTGQVGTEPAVRKPRKPRTRKPRGT